MIHGLLIFNNQGKQRHVQWYTDPLPLEEIKDLVFDSSTSFVSFKDKLIVYRQYATLYFCLITTQESEFAMLDLIQVIVEALDATFLSVCELDLIFKDEETYRILGEIISGGIVLETSLPLICKANV